MNFARSESQRDSILQPRVARHELPWVIRPKHFQPHRGCIIVSQTQCNPFRVNSSWHRVPGVAAARQRRADRWNPDGILPVASPEKQKPAERLVDRLLAAKGQPASADVSALERKLDELVYALYGLTPAEINLVEEAAK